MGIEINTREYVLKKGREPRGRRMWVFQIGNDPDPYWSSPNQPYDSAVSDARKVAGNRGADEIKVLP